MSNPTSGFVIVRDGKPLDEDLEPTKRFLVYTDYSGVQEILDDPMTLDDPIRAVYVSFCIAHPDALTCEVTPPVPGLYRVVLADDSEVLARWDGAWVTLKQQPKLWSLVPV